MKIMTCALAATAAMSALPAFADESVPEYSLLDAIKQGTPMTSFRLRYEFVDQDGLQPGKRNGISGANNPTANEDLQSARALTLRSLIGWQTATFHNFSFAAQLIDVTKLDDNFNDSTNGTIINSLSSQPDRVDYAKVVDPDYTGINQLYVDWTGLSNTRLRLGRQQVNLDNVRFIGDIGFRQVMQVFDGVSVLNKSIPDTELYLAHFEGVRQITTKLRDDGALDIVNVKYRISPTESLVGYGYLSSFRDLGFGRAWFGNTTANEDANQSNQTWGLRLDGAHKFGNNWKALYTAEYARQDDYRGGDSRIDAHYYKLGGGAGYGNFTLRADQELLSSNDGLYAFQTPFGTNHLFQGWVDKFLATPREGIRDSYVTATWKWGDVSLFADYHLLRSDENFYTVDGGATRNGDKYGKEWNAAVAYNYDKHWLGKVEYGKFTEDDHYAAAANTTSNAVGTRGRIRDTEKLWLTVMYTF